jgi:hypothetical protein
MAAVERILTDVGANLANMVEPPTKSAGGDDGQHGAA